MSYSLTVQAEVYFRGLVGDRGGGGEGVGGGKRRGEIEGARAGAVTAAGSGRGSVEERRGGLRLVSSEEESRGLDGSGRRRAGSAD